jgi:hypothetical protein
MPSVLAALETIAALLHKYAPRQAVPVESLLAHAAADDPEHGLDLCGEVLWGERGLWDTGPQVLQRRHDDGESVRRDELAYRAAFLTLAEAIMARNLGTAHERARISEVADTFVTWQREGL